MGVARKFMSHAATCASRIAIPKSRFNLIKLTILNVIAKIV